ncbi:adenosine deaminase [Pseudonocardia humida]|uniref:Adenosine deaminase n=1 Tax=Pseudonocardia humida TaxID=2800819 RepID=A0ABT0ZYH8_9PSEU|nr:adenosine deaminase [Pseudonocardia humida]MCO1655802.1 adenosine deaminase [Pseudonocardia humida]
MAPPAHRDLRSLPKAHLHVHLESTVRPATLAEIARGNGLPAPPSPALFAGFGAFAEHSGAVRDVLCRPDDFRRIAVEFCADQAADGVRYVEVTFTALGHGSRLGDLAMPLEAVLDGLVEGAATTGIGYGVILDHPRRRSVERARRTLDLAVRHAADGVVGIGLAGREEHPVEPFAEVFADARAAGVHVVHHAGETCGPASVRAALDAGRAERIGHGIRALDDPDLVAELRERRIPLEVCPSSNAALGLVGSLAGHPLARMLAAGLTVAVGTDVPDVTGRDLTAELAAVRDTLELDDAAIAGLNRTAIDASFAPAAVKAELHRGTARWLDGVPDPA